MFGDRRLGMIELLAAITLERGEDLTGEALRMHAHWYVATAPDITHHQRAMLAAQARMYTRIFPAEDPNLKHAMARRQGRHCELLDASRGPIGPRQCIHHAGSVSQCGAGFRRGQARRSPARGAGRGESPTELRQSFKMPCSSTDFAGRLEPPFNA